MKLETEEEDKKHELRKWSVETWGRLKVLKMKKPEKAEKESKPDKEEKEVKNLRK